MLFPLQTPQEFESDLRTRLLRPEYSDCIYNEYGPYGYDAVWALALMLNRSVEILKTYDFDDDKRRCLEDFDYGNREMSRLFFELLNETEFMGLSVWQYKIIFSCF